MNPKHVHDTGFEEEWDQVARQHPEWGHQWSVMELTRTILEAMEDQGVTQAELARRAGLQPSYLSRIMNTPENITMRTAFRLCNALDLELGFDIRPKEIPLFAQRPVRKPKVHGMPPPVTSRKQAAAV